MALDKIILESVIQRIANGEEINAIRESLIADGVRKDLAGTLLYQAKERLRRTGRVLVEKRNHTEEGENTGVFEIDGDREEFLEDFLQDEPQVVENSALAGSILYNPRESYQKERIELPYELLDLADETTEPPGAVLPMELPTINLENKLNTLSNESTASVPDLQTPYPTKTGFFGKSSRLREILLTGASIVVGGAAGLALYGANFVYNNIYLNQTESASTGEAQAPVIVPSTVLEVQSPVIKQNPIVQQSQEQVSLTEIVEEEKIFRYLEGDILTIYPIKGHGLAEYAAVISGTSDFEALADMSYAEQKNILLANAKGLPRGKKSEVREVLDIVKKIGEQNPENVYNENPTREGLKDSTANVVYPGVPLSFFLDLAPVAKTLASESPALESMAELPQDVSAPTLPISEERIFTYDIGDNEDPSDDTLKIYCTLPGVGISQYVAAMAENSWSRKSLSVLAQQTPSVQAALVQKANKEHFNGLNREERALIISITKDVIDTNLDQEKNPTPIVHDVNYSTKGMKDGNKNRVYQNTILEVPVPEDVIPSLFTKESQESLENIIQDNQTRENLPGLGRITEEYFELRQIEKEIPIVEDPVVMNEVVLNFARQYNQTQENGKPIYNIVDPTVSKQQRLELARDLYTKVGDRRDRETYMTVKEIMQFVNEGLDEKMNVHELRTNLIDTRQGTLHREVQDRRFEVWEQYLEDGYGKNKSSLVRGLASKYGVSTSTIYKDIRSMENEAPEPRNIAFV